MTNLRTSKLGIRPYHIGFTGVATKLYEKSSGKSVLVDNAVLEGELLDGQTGERVAVLVDREPQASLKDQKKKREGKKRSWFKNTFITSDDPSWAKVEDTLEFYARRLRERLDKERGKEPFALAHYSRPGRDSTYTATGPVIRPDSEK